MQSLSRSAYSDAFSYSDPKATGSLLKARMAAAREVNERLAQYFSERADAEEAYAQAIQRALTSLKAGKSPLDLQHNPALGSPSAGAVERVIVHESAEVVRMHEVFARRCRDQLEVPLRSRASKDDWLAVQKQERNTEALLKEYEEAQHRLQKAHQKASGSLGGKKNAEKIPALQEDVSLQEARWVESAPAYLQAYQQFDFARLTSIKELLTVYETLQNDLGRERMETAERGLESILTWEVEQDLTEFVSREGFKGGSGRAPARGPSNSNLHTNGRQQTASPLPPIVNVDSPTGEFGQGTGGAPQAATTPMRQRTNTDTQSIRSGHAASITSSRQGDGRGGGGFLSAFKSGGGGNKLDRRKSTAVQQQQQRQALNGGDSDDERDAFRSSGSASLGRPSRDRQQSVRSGGLASDDEELNRGGGLKVNTGKSKRNSFMPGFLRRNNTSARRDSFSERQSQRETTPRASEAPMQPRTAPAQTTHFRDETPLASPLSENRRPNNNFDEMEEITTPAMSPDPPKTSKSLNPFSSSMGGAASGGAIGATISAAAVAAIVAGENNDRQPQVDEHGYTVPPADYNKPAWQSGGASGDLMVMPESDDESQIAPQNLRVNIAPTTERPGETDAEREAAMQRMKNTLLQNKSPTIGSSVGRRGTRAGGRGSRQSTLGLAPLSTSPGDEVPLQSIVDAHRQGPQQQERETAPLSATPSSPNGSFMIASPNAPPVPSIPTPVRAGSILSTSSSQQQMSGVTSSFASAKTGASGFRAAILETVNVLFRNGQRERVLVTGSVALSLNIPVDGPLKIRIANYERFDKSAPNKAFLHATSTPGEFTVDAQALQNSNTPVTTVLKYQVKTDNLNARAFVPVEVYAQWKLEPNQTSFLMTYHGNPECQFASADPSPFGEVSSEAVPRLQDVAFSVPVIGEDVSNVQSKPAGTYSLEKHRILWKMDDLDMSTSRAAKILARWQVGSTAQPQPVSVQWRLPNRLASQTDLQVVGNEDVKLDEIIKSTSSGKYQAH